jgi:lysophospholipase L1-like esterase
VPRRIFPAGTVTNTTGAPLRLTFHADSSTSRRETDLWTIDSSNNLSEQIPNGIIVTDTSGAYSAFAGPVDSMSPRTGAPVPISATGTTPSTSSALRSGVVMAPGPYRVGGTVFTTDLSNGTDTGINTRSAHRDPQPIQTIEVVYANYAANGAAGETITATGTYTLRAAVEYPSGSYWPLRFQGKRDATIEAGGVVTSARLSIPGGIPANTVFWVRTYVTVTSGDKWGSGWSVDSTAPWLEATEQSTSESDLTTSGTITGTSGKPFRPIAIRSIRPADTLRLIGLGDSIISAVGDATDLRRGWFGILTDQSVSAVRMGCSAEKLTSFTGGGMQARMAATTPGCNVAICALGVNDVAGGSNLATIQARMQTLWEFLYRQGIKVWQTTITPYSVTTTDSYATTTNQTVHSSNAVRVTVNDWLRGLTPGTGGGQYLSGIVEFADVVESARNSGKWKVTGTANYATTDGTHPSSALHTLMAAAVPLSSMRTTVGVTT